jgi:hypothetical protein
MNGDDAPGQFVLGLPNAVHTVNTGNLVTPMGQRIAWTVVKQTKSRHGPVFHVAFYDLDRGVCGMTKLTVSAVPLQQALLAAYARDHYLWELKDLYLRETLREAAHHIEGIKP